MRIKFWGVRGSIPAPMTTEQLQERLIQALMGAQGIDLSDPTALHAYIARLPPSVRALVGGNTACVEIDTGEATIIVDCGSGMRLLGEALMQREFGMGLGTAHIFMTHAHWDHLQGYPFFAPAYVPGNRLIFYAVGANPRTYLEHQQVAPTYFPIPPRPADAEYTQLAPGQAVQIGRAVVSSLALYHPGTAYAFRFDDGESVFVYASDGEYKALDEASLRPYVNFFYGADALVFDSQYSPPDVFLSKEDWGHSTAMIGVEIAKRARVKRLITYHHDPTHSDEQIHDIAARAAEYAGFNQPNSETEVIVASEGLELFLGQSRGLEIVEDRSGEAWTIAMAGRLDDSTIGEARSRFQDFLGAAGSRPVIVDLNLIATLDTQAVKALLEATRQVPRGRLALVARPANIRRVLELFSVQATILVFRTRRQALAALIGPTLWEQASDRRAHDYALIERITVDDWGAVYLGRSTADEINVVIHLVYGSVEDPDRLSFERTAQGWLGQDHPLLLAGRHLIRESDWSAFVSEWAGGQSLREWMKLRPPLERALHMAERLLEAVAYLHDVGVIHGDLLPEAVAVPNGAPIVSHSPLFRRNGERAESEAYRAPEEQRGQLPSPAGDVYSLGILLYQLLLGSDPFPTQSEEMPLALKIQSRQQGPRANGSSGGPEELDEFLLRMLAANPADRFPSAVEAHAEFQRLVPELLQPQP